jgi:hypothetical protein
MGKITIKKKTKDGRVIKVEAETTNPKVGLLDKLYSSKKFRKNVKL